MAKPTKKQDRISDSISESSYQSFNFEEWAGAVREQMLAALRRRGVQ